MKNMGDPLHMFEHVYAEPTPELNAQREEFAQTLAGPEKEGANG